RHEVHLAQAGRAARRSVSRGDRAATRHEGRVLTVEVERLRLTPGTRLLDVGCGGGRHIRLSRDLPGVRAVAMDLGAKEVEETRASLELLDKLPPKDGGSIP